MSGPLPFWLACLAIGACWVPRAAWLAWGLFVAAVLLALGDHLSLAALPAIALVGAAVAALRGRAGGHPAAWLAVFFVAVPLFLFHDFDLPGFEPLEILSAVQVSPDAEPYSLTLHFGPLVLGFFYCRFLLRPATPAELMAVLRLVAVLTLAAAGLLLGPALMVGYVRWDPKLPSFALVWTLSNLLFVAVPEEALFRGLLQRGLSGAGRLSGWLAASILFGLFHLRWGIENAVLAGIAGLLFGWAWLRTERIEAPVLLHFLVNALHFFLFSYPRLA